MSHRVHRKTWILFALTGAASLCLLGRALAFPQPNIVQSSWQLDYKYDHPRVVSLTLPGESTPRVFWYITYTVTNNTGGDQNFIPELTALTDEGDFLRGNKNISPAVFRALDEALKNPLLRSPNEVVGKLLQGPDNAVDGIAIWEIPANDVDHVTFFFNGLSGETHEVENPVTKEKVYLRRTLQIDYQTPGSVEQQPRKPWLFKGEEWVVR